MLKTYSFSTITSFFASQSFFMQYFILILTLLIAACTNTNDIQAENELFEPNSAAYLASSMNVYDKKELAWILEYTTSNTSKSWLNIDGKIIYKITPLSETYKDTEKNNSCRQIQIEKIYTKKNKKEKQGREEAKGLACRDRNNPSRWNIEYNPPSSPSNI